MSGSSDSLSKTILAHAFGLPSGSSIRARDFIHLGGRAAVDQALSRLARRGQIHRSGRGVYTAVAWGREGLDLAPGQTSAWQAKRRKILAVAGDLFGERGFDGVSMREIAAPAKIHMATLYHYFPDKQSLYTAVVREAFEMSAQRSLAALAPDGTPAERLRSWLISTTEFLFDISPAARLMEREILLSRGAAHPVPQEAMTMSRFARDEIAALVVALDPPIARQLSPSRVTEMLRSLVYGVVNQRGVFQGMDPSRRDLALADIRRDLLVMAAHVLNLPPQWAKG